MTGHANGNAIDTRSNITIRCTGAAGRAVSQINIVLHGPVNGNVRQRREQYRHTKGAMKMKCPRCKAELRSTDLGEYGFVILDVCTECQGTWFDKGELDRLDDSVWTNVEELDFKPGAEGHEEIYCPKCNQEKLDLISPKDAAEVVVDRCPSCQGFWLDKDELDKMREAATQKDGETLERMTPLSLQAIGRDFDGGFIVSVNITSRNSHCRTRNADVFRTSRFQATANTRVRTATLSRSILQRSP